MPGGLRRFAIVPILGAIMAFAAESAAQITFPLAVAPGGRTLVDAAGKPFLLHGEAAWSLIAQLRREDVEIYLADRRARGFNAILVSLIERKYASHAPNNAYGAAPFLVPGDFTTPNEAYFAHADWVLRRAAEEGFLVLLTPSYAGFEGGDAGWYREMVAAGAAGCGAMATTWAAGTGRSPTSCGSTAATTIPRTGRW